MDVRLSAGSRAALLSLTTLQSQATTLQSRIASGKKVRSALDNPRAFFAAAAMTSRVGLLSDVSSNLVNAQSAIGAASNGITALRSLLTSAQSIAKQALNVTPTYASTTGTNSGALGTSSTIASFSGSSTRFRNNDVITVSDGTTTATYTASSGDTVQTFLNAINNTSGLKITASLNASGQIKLAADANVDITIGANLGGSGTLNGVIGLTAGTTLNTPDAARQSLALQFDDIVAQIDQMAFDAGFNGINLLTGSTMTVSLNESGSSQITLNGADMTASGLGVSASSNSFQTDADINAALSSITSAIASLQTASVRFDSIGSTMQARQDFNTSMINTLNSGADALTASDVNEDSALLLALQTRQQIAASTLSLTHGDDSTVLALFGLNR
jgi:flagellin-like hook-associated protein FlgL